MEQDETNDQHRALGAENQLSGAVTDFLRNEFNFPTIDMYVERQYERTGWLSVLEQAGIVPVIANPNPFDWEREEAAYIQWWDEHLDAYEHYEQQQAARRTILKVLHIGAILGHLDGPHLYPARDFPDITQR